MDNEKLKKLEMHYQISSILGLLGLIDIITNQITPVADMGYISMAILYVFKFLFGIKVAAFFVSIFTIILGLSVLLLINAYVIKRKINRIKKQNENTN